MARIWRNWKEIAFKKGYQNKIMLYLVMYYMYIYFYKLSREKETIDSGQLKSILLQKFPIWLKLKPFSKPKLLMNNVIP